MAKFRHLISLDKQVEHQAWIGELRLRLDEDMLMLDRDPKLKRWIQRTNALVVEQLLEYGVPDLPISGSIRLEG